jgi:hypothetical protein
MITQVLIFALILADASAISDRGKKNHQIMVFCFENCSGFFEIFFSNDKAELLLLKFIQIFARTVLVMKKLEIEETKTA